MSQACRGTRMRQSDEESALQSCKQPPRRGCHRAERPEGPSRPAAAAAASCEPWGLQPAHAGLLPGPCCPPHPSPHPSVGCDPALSGPPQTDALLPAQAMAAVRRCGMGTQEGVADKRQPSGRSLIDSLRNLGPYHTCFPCATSKAASVAQTSQQPATYVRHLIYKSRPLGVEMQGDNRLDTKLPTFAFGRRLLFDASCLKRSWERMRARSPCMSGIVPGNDEEG